MRLIVSFGIVNRIHFNLFGDDVFSSKSEKEFKAVRVQSQD